MLANKKTKHAAVKVQNDKKQLNVCLLKDIPTYALVDELRKREAVNEIIADIEESYILHNESQIICNSGPAILLEIVD